MAAGKCLRRYGGHWPHGYLTEGVNSFKLNTADNYFNCMCCDEDVPENWLIFWKDSWALELRWINSENGGISMDDYFRIKGYGSWPYAEDETLAEVWEGRCTSDCQEYKSGFGGIIGNQSSNPS